MFLHNNLDVSHIIRNNDNVLISWDKATLDLPIYDFIRLYKKILINMILVNYIKNILKDFPY